MIIAGLAAGPALAADPQHVLRVEEDWEVTLDEPENLLDSPQFHTAMSPNGEFDRAYAQVVWNYRELPNFQAGGLQVQGWMGDWTLSTKSIDRDQLSTVAETVRWTQVMQSDGSRAWFEIVNGYSQTWGVFGGSNTRVSNLPGVSNLDNYATSASATNSWVTHGSNRVLRMQIKEVRYYGQNGLLYVDTTPHTVFESDQ